jgi:hypothetical protein
VSNPQPGGPGPCIHCPPVTGRTSYSPKHPVSFSSPSKTFSVKVEEFYAAWTWEIRRWSPILLYIGLEHALVSRVSPHCLQMNFLIVPPVRPRALYQILIYIALILGPFRSIRKSQFEVRSRDRLYWEPFYGFAQYLQANSGIIP